MNVEDFVKETLKQISDAVVSVENSEKNSMCGLISLYILISLWQQQKKHLAILQAEYRLLLL